MQSRSYGKCLCCLWACVSCLSLSHCPCTGWRDSVLPVTLEIPLLLHSAPEIQHGTWRDTTQPSYAALCSVLQHTQSKVNLAKQHLYPSGSKAFLKHRRNCGTISSAGFDKTDKVCLGFCLSSKWLLLLSKCRHSRIMAPRLAPTGDFCPITDVCMNM